MVNYIGYNAPLSSGANIPNIVNPKSQASCAGAAKVMHNPAYSAFSAQQGFLLNNEFKQTEAFLNMLCDKNTISKLLAENPELQLTLKKAGLDGQIYENNIKSIANSHLNTTRKYALEIAKQMKLGLGEQMILARASILHDVGKLFIPESVVNKPGKFSEDEKRIMDNHAHLGALLLRNTNYCQPRVLHMINNHHETLKESAQKNTITDYLTQILQIADKYSALLEPRPYKSAMSPNDAFAILEQEANNGLIDPNILNALKVSQNVAICAA